MTKEKQKSVAAEIEIPQFTDELKKTLLDNASLDFDWSEIVSTTGTRTGEVKKRPTFHKSGAFRFVTPAGFKPATF